METVYLDNIPQELKWGKTWVGWKWTTKPNGDRTKTPRDPKAPRNASSTDSTTWGTYEQAVSGMKRGAYDGIGYVFTHDAGYVGIDFDDCYDEKEGVLREPESRWVEALESYTEVSPSGTGVKVIFKGTLPESLSRRGFGQGNGIYDSGRFFTITGRDLEGEGINEVSPERLAPLLAEWFPPQERGNANWEATGERLTDREVLGLAHRAANGEHFDALYRGDWEETGQYSSQSEADAALVMMLSFFTGPCPEQIDRLFRASGLYREKWDEQRGALTYGEGTIEKVLETRDEYFTPRDIQVTQEDEDVDEMVQPLVAPPTRKEMQSRWKGMLEGYPSLRRSERPYLLDRVVEHIRPTAVRLGEDWMDFMAITNFSTCFPNLRFGNMPLNLWTIGINKQAIGKSAVGDELDTTFRAVAAYRGERLLRYSSGSTAGLIRRLQGAGSQVLAFFSEFSGFLNSLSQDHNSDMREKMMDLYDGRSMYHQLATESINVEQPFVTVCGVTTVTGFVDSAEAIDANNGFYSRMWFCCPEYLGGKLRFRTEAERNLLVQDICDHLESLPEVNSISFDTPGGREPACLLEYSGFLGEEDDEEGGSLDDELLNRGDESLPGGRLIARVLKISALLELMESTPNIRRGVLYIRESNVAKAIRLVQRGAAYATRAFGWLARSKDEGDAAMVRQSLERYPTLTMAGILRATYLSRAEATRAVELLMDEGIVVTTIDANRKIYFLRNKRRTAGVPIE